VPQPCGKVPPEWEGQCVRYVVGIATRVTQGCARPAVDASTWTSRRRVNWLLEEPGYRRRASCRILERTTAGPSAAQIGEEGRHRVGTPKEIWPALASRL